MAQGHSRTKENYKGTVEYQGKGIPRAVFPARGNIQSVALTRIVSQGGNQPIKVIFRQFYCGFRIHVPSSPCNAIEYGRD